MYPVGLKIFMSSDAELQVWCLNKGIWYFQWISFQDQYFFVRIPKGPKGQAYLSEL